MKIIVISDSHGATSRIKQVLELHPDADYYIHCGDLEDEPIEPFLYVCGNNDYNRSFPDSRIIVTTYANIFVTHGHLFGFQRRLENIVAHALQVNCSIVCYGHTHIPMDTIIEGVRCINPGSLSYNRDGSDPSYVEMNFNKLGELQVLFHTLPLPKKQRKFHLF